MRSGIDILDDDRELMEETHTLVREVKDLLGFLRDKQADTHRETRNEIREVKESINELPPQTEKAINSGFEDIIESVKHKSNIKIKIPWYRRIFTRRT